MKIKQKKANVHTRYLSQAIQLEETINPHIANTTMLIISLAVLSFLIWSSYANINEIARIPGEIVPKGKIQSVQHIEGGTVSKIHVSDGVKVKKNQILLELDATGLKSDLGRAKARQHTLLTQEERIRAYLENRQPDFSKFSLTGLSKKDQSQFFSTMIESRSDERAIITEQIAQKDQTINSLKDDLTITQKNYEIIKSLHEKRAQLNKMGYSPTIKLLESQKQLNDIEGDIKRINSRIKNAIKEKDEFKKRLLSLDSKFDSESNEKLDAILSEIAQNAELIEKLETRISQLSVPAPSDGVVKGLSVNTLGAVIQPGQIILEIVPTNTQLEVSIKISPQYIGHLKRGQSVQVKFSTFDFSRYGLSHGILQDISATTFKSENGERYYLGTVTLDKNYVGEDTRNIIIPGMTVMADVITGEKTILQYLLKPIHNSLKSAFTEQ